MKLALVADLHANREAVAAVFAHDDAQGAERFAFLGDFVGYGADPGWVVDAVRERIAAGAIAVAGNHDAAVLRGPLPSMTSDARTTVTWTRARLVRERARTFERIASFSQSVLTLTDDVPEPVTAEVVSADYWTLLRIQPIAGRAFVSEEDDPATTACSCMRTHGHPATGNTSSAVPTPRAACSRRTDA